MHPTSSIGAWAVTAKEAWRYRLDVPPVAMHAAPDDSYLLVADVFGTVRCLETASGALRWERTFGMQNVHDVRATLAGATVLLEEGRLIRLDAADGADRWETQVGALRSGFDATADGALVATSAAVHEVREGEVIIGSEVSLWDAQGQATGAVRLGHAVTRLRFTSERGDLVCISPEGHVSFLKDTALARETQLGSTLEGLVTCLDGSLILTPAGTDGIHVLSAAMQSLGVLEVSGPVEDVDVSEDGSAILVKERDGLIYLMDGRFRLRWRGRMERPVLRVDLAGDGSFAYAAESTGEILRFDFRAEEHAAQEVAIPEGTPALAAPARIELEGAPVRAGLGRLAFLGGGALAVLSRPSQLLSCTAGATQATLERIGFSAAHATPDPASDRVALWSGRQITVRTAAAEAFTLRGKAFSTLAFLPEGDVAVGTAAGQILRIGADGAERFSARVGAAVLAVQPCETPGHLLVLCADGSLVRVGPDGAVLAAKELGASVVAQPDVVGKGEALEGAAAPRGGADFWDKYGRTFSLRATPWGPLVYHGMGRVLQLDDGLQVVAECHLGQELSDLQACGEGYLAVEAHGAAAMLDRALAVTARFALGSRRALPALGPEGAAILDATDEAVILRGLDGAVIRQAEVYPTPRALAVSPDGRRGAALLDTSLLVFDLTA